MNSIMIADRKVGDGEPTFIIAEAGSNHNRDLDQAKKLIDVAIEAEADAVKFQTYSAEKLYSKKTPKPSYLEAITSENETVWDLIKKIELPREFQSELADYCKDHGIIFLSTPFDIDAIDELDELGMVAYKIASFEIVDLPLLKHVASKGKPVLISTGMANIGDIEDALKTVYSTGNENVALLHCNIGYPPPMDTINLRAIQTMKKAFDVPIGYSDHTMSVTIPSVAVSVGACLIEKHFTLDRSMQGPDHPFALEPKELKEMVRNIRDVELALGDGKKQRSEEEEEMYRIGRRSIVAAQDIPKGTAISEEMLTIKRPGFGIKPKFLEILVGRSAKVDIEEDDIITWDMI
jgi:N-acetylneuraminate synthase/N,N'-diacetyllegionaminate synthase